MDGIKKLMDHCNFCASYDKVVIGEVETQHIAEGWRMDAEDMSGKGPEREVLTIRHS